MAHNSLQALLILFPGYNTLDVNGPLEVLGNTALPTDTFKITVASDEELTLACEGVRIHRDKSFNDLLNPVDGKSPLEQYDILVVPGGRQAAVEAVLQQKTSAFLDVIETFSNLQTPDRQRWVISVCTGAQFLAARGILAGMKATGHWRTLEITQKLADEASKTRGLAATEISRLRWADGGRNKAGVRVVTSGGVSCGIDGVLWYLSEVVDLGTAKKVAEAIDYNWCFVEGVYTKEFLVGSST